ncbi:MAG: hypothetical protein JWO13_1187 [Acidobacteriales bacterium]|nr:hypothetical protein [Terriglobales bacterium]
MAVRLRLAAFLTCLTVLTPCLTLHAQSTNPASSLPRLIKYSGVLKEAPARTVGLIFTIYDKQDSLSPLWLETQSVTVDEGGRYNVLLGSTTTDGLPSSIFANGDARWIGVQEDGEAEQTRTLLVSVPYALKAGDAETLGGKPLSAFLLADSGTASSGVKSQRLQESSAANKESTGTFNTTTTNAFPNALAKFDATTNIVNSTVFEDNSGNIGIGTATPTARLDIGSTGGDIALGYNFQGTSQLFKGFGTAHALTNVPSQFNVGLLDGAFTGVSVQDVRDGSFNSASIAFTTHHGGISAGTRMVIDKDGRVGIGTLTPSSPLEVVGTIKANILTDGFISFGAAQINRTGGAVEFQFPGGAGNDVRFFSNAASPVSFLASSGNVGIGTASPTFKLQVQGIAKANSFTDGFMSMGLAQINRSGGAVELQLPGGSGNDVKMFSGTSTPITFVAASGSVGIGTTSPTTALDVSGQIRAGSGFKFADATIQTTAVPSNCAATQIPKWSGTAWACATDATGAGGGGGGTVTSITAGSGLSGGTITAAGTIGVDSTVARTNAANAFAGTQTVTGNITATGVNDGNLTGGVINAFSGNFSGVNGGVVGHDTNTAGSHVGVFGTIDSPSGNGVQGTAGAATGIGIGVRGTANSVSGTAGQFDNTAGGDLLKGFSGIAPVLKFRVDGNGNVLAAGYRDLNGNPIPSGTVTTAGDGLSLQGTTLAVDNTVVRSTDARLTDARTPVAGSNSYIQNGTTPQAANLSITGSVTANTFAGNGSALTNLAAGSIAGGTAGINISGTAATATTAANALALGGTAPAAFEQVANKNAVSGYAGLDAGSRIAKAQAPSASAYTDSANTFSAGIQDFSSAAATLPVKAVPAANTPGTCVASKEMLVKTDATPGQQLFICNVTGDGYVQIGAATDLSNLNAANLTSGIVPNARLSGTYGSILALNNPSNTLAGNGSAITGLAAANINAGIAAINISGTAASFTGTLSGDVTGTQLATVISSLPATKLTGTVADARLSSNVALLNITNTFSPTSDVSAVTVKQTSAVSPNSDIFSVQNNAGSSTYLKVNNAGALSWNGTASGSINGNAATATVATTATSATSFSGSLAGDVTGPQATTVVATVGGSTAANVNLATVAANAATNANTASTIVKRDASGNFAAGTITAALSGNATTATTATNATTAVNFSGSLAGNVTGTQGATVVASVGGSTAANVNTATVAANAATNLSTASTIVKRDASGNFTAGTITAALFGNATTATSAGSATNFSGALAGDVTGTQGATVIASLDASKLTGTVVDARLTANVPLVNAANAFAPTTDITGVTVKQTTSASPTKDIFSVTDKTGATNFLNVNNAGAVSWTGTAGGNISGNAATATAVTNGVVTTGSYADPSWITSLDGSKITGSVASSSNFTGALSGDVTGTQGVTAVSKINGSPLGTTTGASSGQALVWSGSNWAPSSVANSLIAGTGISVSGATGSITVGNTGVLSVLGAGPISSSGGQAPSISCPSCELSPNKNAANGYAGLDAVNRIAKAQAPSTTVYTDAANTFSAGIQDFSSAAATLPVKAVLAINTPLTCTASKELLVKTDVAPGQQLFICNPGGNGYVPVGAATDLSNLNASNLTSGILPSARFSGNYSGVISLSNPGNSLSGDGTNISNVNAANLGGSPGSSFARLNTPNTFNSNQSINSGPSPNTVNGTTTSDFIPVVQVNNNASATAGIGIRAITNSASATGGWALDGEAVATTGSSGRGVRGSSNGENGIGIFAFSGSTLATGSPTAFMAVNGGNGNTNFGTAGVFINNSSNGKILSGQAGGSERFAVDNNGNVTLEALVVTPPNDATTGTGLNLLAKLNGTGGVTVVTPSTSDTGGVVGVIIGSAGTTGKAQMVYSGGVFCMFDGATVAGDYVQISATVAGNCHDAGAAFPSSGQVLGRVIAAQGTAGLAQMFLAGETLGQSATVASTGLSGTYGNALNFTNAGNTFTGDGSALNSLNASNLSSGTVADARLNGQYSGALDLSNALNTVKGSFNGDGSALTNLNPTNIAAGTAGINISGTAATATNALNLGGAAPAAYEQVANKNSSNGYPGLDSGARILKAQAPSTTVFTDLPNTFSSGIQDFSGAGATIPTKSVLAANTPATCIASKEMLVKTDVTPGQQLFICNATGNGYVQVGAATDLSNLNATNLTSGTVPSARLNGTYGNALTFSSAGNSFSGNGSALTSLNASNLASGTLPDARLSGTYTSALTLSGAITATNASNNLNASTLGSVTAANYARLDIPNTFNSNQTIVSGALPNTISGSTTNFGAVWGVNNTAGANGGGGVRAVISSTGGFAPYAIDGQALATTGSTAIGVRGSAAGESGVAVYGFSSSTLGTGSPVAVKGENAAFNTGNTNPGIAGLFINNSSNGKILSGQAPSGQEKFAVDNSGNVTLKGVVVTPTNDTTTGTGLNLLAKLNGATVVKTSTADSFGVVGIIIGGAGTAGSSQMVSSGFVNCIFDGATVAGDYVQISSTVAGDCHDAGAAFPGSGQVLGRVMATLGSAGSGLMLLTGETRAQMATYNGEGSTQAIIAPHTVIGRTTISGATVVNFNATTQFTSSVSYVCTSTSTTGVSATGANPTSGSSFTLTGTNADVVAWQCTGN